MKNVGWTLNSKVTKRGIHFCFLIKKTFANEL